MPDTDVKPVGPETPGSQLPFIKPDIPNCWTPQPVKDVSSNA